MKKFTPTKAYLTLIAFLFSSFISISVSSYATNYYVSSSIIDSTYNGLTPSTPFKSIDKVNSVFSTFSAGDSILFKRGDIFYGSLIVSKSGSLGNNIVIGAYGTGAKPIITGFTTATFTSLGSNLWQTNNLPATTKKVNMVLKNGVDLPMGRYPNYGYRAVTASTTDTSITDATLSGTPNFTGGEIIIRKFHWLFSRDSITSHSGTTIYYDGTSGWNTTNGFGYFIQNSQATLDTANEWYFNATSKKLIFYSTVSPTSVKVATIDTLINAGSRNYITVENISFEGANMFAIAGGGYSYGRNCVFKNCDINFSGRDGIYMTASKYDTVRNCTINNSHNNGISFASVGGTSDTVTIINNSIKNTGLIPGMGFSDYRGYCGIIAYGTSALIQYNTIDSTGYDGIEYRYNYSKVKYNKISNFCSVLDDGAAIYTTVNAVAVNTGREVIGNIILNGIGAPDGTADKNNYAQGIYTDEGASGVTIDSNSVSNVGNSGIYLHNSNDIKVRNNNVIGCGKNQFSIAYNAAGHSPTRNIVVQKNVFVATNIYANILDLLTISNDIGSFAATSSAWNNNYYCRPLDENLTIHVSSSTGGGDFTFGEWRANYPGYDSASRTSPVIYPAYTLNSLLTANLVTNGTFTSSVASFYKFSNDSTTTVTWDNTSKVNGTGSMKITPGSSSNNYTFIYSAAGGIGAVSTSKKYILRVTTVGTAYGTLQIYLRQNSSPLTRLSDIQTSAYNTQKKVHEFLITPTTSDAAATFLIAVQENTGITYLDDIEFYEANATVIDNSGKIRFDYNATTSATNVSLGSTIYREADSTLRNSSITLPPYSSKILFANGTCSLPAGWATQDIGATSLAGSACEDAGTYTLQGSNDVYGNSDRFRFAYKKVGGNNTIIAKEFSFSGSGTSPKAGVMIRESLAVGSKNVFVTIRADGNSNAQYRLMTDSASTTVSGTSSVTLPYWVKITRVADTIKGYISSNGSTWVLKCNLTIHMADSVYMGLATSSSTSTSLATAVFKNVSIQGGEILRVNNSLPALALASPLPVSEGIYPNPASGTFYIGIHSVKDDKGKISIADMKGQVVYTETRTLIKGNNKLVMNSQSMGLAAGLYTIRFSSANKQYQKRLVIK